MTELWKRAVATGGRYEVSNIGRCRRFDGLLLKASVPRNKREYPCVMLRYEGKRKRIAVHRLVALNFLGLPPHAGAEVRHLDGDHMNPRWDNLAWGTAKTNAADRDKHGTTQRGAGHWSAKLTESDVAAIKSSPLTTARLASEYGVHRTTVQRIRGGQRWSAALRARAAQ